MNLRHSAGAATIDARHNVANIRIDAEANFLTSINTTNTLLVKLKAFQKT